MTLKDWLAREGILPAHFADQIGETRQLVDNWLKRRNRPSIGRAVKVRQATNGEVDFTDWMPRMPRKRKW